MADAHVLGGDTKIEPEIRIRPDGRPTQQELRRRAHMLELKLDDYEHFYISEEEKDEIRKGIVPSRILNHTFPPTPVIFSFPKIRPSPKSPKSRQKRPSAETATTPTHPHKNP